MELPEEVLQLFPPFRFAAVDEDVHRGAYPTIRNFRFLKRLHLRTIISLIPEEPTSDLSEFCKSQGVSLVPIYVRKWEENITITQAVAKQVCEIAARQENLPLYLHCLDGANTTGVAVMCMRKMQNWSAVSILQEFARYSRSDAVQDSEKAFLEAFTGELTLPRDLPAWLSSPMVDLERHPSIKIRLEGEEVAGSSVQEKPSSPFDWEARIRVDTSAPERKNRDILALDLETSGGGASSSSGASRASSVREQLKHYDVV